MNKGLSQGVGQCFYLADPITRRRQTRVFSAGQTLAELAPVWARPYVASVNGQAVPRAHWDQALQAGDVPCFVALPEGPAIALVAMYIAEYAAVEIAFSVAADYAISTMAFDAIYYASYAAVFMGSNALLSSVVGLGGNPSSMQAEAAAAASPTYSVSTQSNQARINQPIPTQYGRMKRFPDLLSAPLSDFRTHLDANGDQYLTQSFMLGQGHYEIEGLYIDDTPIANYAEVSYGFVTPGNPMPSDVAQIVSTVAEISSNTLETGLAVAVVAVPEGRSAERIDIDLVCSRGLYFTADNGSLTEKSVNVKIEARAVGNVTWTELSQWQLSGATTTPQRRTISLTGLASARYEVRLTRTDSKDTSYRAGHEVVWAACKVWLNAPASFDANYGDTTRLWVIMRASEQLSGLSARRLAVICTRKLPIWNGSSWSAPLATRSIAWALADIARSKYGGKLGNSQIDLGGLLALDAQWSARGDRFDAVFDNRITVWEALGRTVRAGRGRAYLQGGRVCFARDRLEAMPIAMFSPANMLPNSFNIQYLMPSEQTAEEVRVRYFSEATWKADEVIYTHPSADPDKFAEIELFGVTSATQAGNEARYLAQTNRYRRRTVTFDIELEAMILSPLDPILISHDLPDWGQWALSDSYNAATNTLTADRPLKWSVGLSHYARLRARDGRPSAALAVSRGACDACLVFAQTPPSIDLQGCEPSHIAFGAGTAWQVQAKVLTIRPKDEYTATVSAVIEDARVHENC
jgi:sulfur carrier protein ThiS